MGGHSVQRVPPLYSTSVSFAAAPSSLAPSSDTNMQTLHHDYKAIKLLSFRFHKREGRRKLGINQRSDGIRTSLGHTWSRRVKHIMPTGWWWYDIKFEISALCLCKEILTYSAAGTICYPVTSLFRFNTKLRNHNQTAVALPTFATRWYRLIWFAKRLL